MALRALFIYLQWYPCICLTFLLLDPKNIPRRSDSCQNYYIESLWCFQISYKTKKKINWVLIWHLFYESMLLPHFPLFLY